MMQFLVIVVVVKHSFIHLKQIISLLIVTEFFAFFLKHIYICITYIYELKRKKKCQHIFKSLIFLKYNTNAHLLRYLDTDFFLKMKFTFWRGFFCSPNLNKIKKRAHMRILITQKYMYFFIEKKN